MIEKVRTPVRRLILAVLAYFALTIIVSWLLPADSSFMQELEGRGFVFLGAFVAIGVVLCLPYYMIKRDIKRRANKLALLADQNSWQLSGAPLRSPIFEQLALRDKTFFNTLASTNWRYADHRHALYAKMKNGEYKAVEVYYSVLELDLPRALPHIVIDSKVSHRKQFAGLFDRSQRHSLEGNFDHYFATYFPKFYSVDGLSIISPEVMQAMIAARQFDIEIYSDKLYLYGPLVPVNRIPEMIKVGELIRQKLKNNILTYRDENLDSIDRSQVAMFGARLRPNPYKNIATIGTGLPFIAAFFFFLSMGVFEYQSLFIGLVLAGTGVYSIWKTKRANRQLDELYRSAMRFKESKRIKPF